MIDHMNKHFATIFFSRVGITFLSATVIFFVQCGGQEEVVQPIEYSHYIHFNDVGLDCTDCHIGVEDYINATIPTIEICADCHEEMKGESKAEEGVVEAVSNGDEIPWQRIYVLPDHVFFSHRRHVNSGKISCKLCHGDVGNLHSPPKNQIIPISMDYCMKCHDSKSISNDCITCHV